MEKSYKQLCSEIETLKKQAEVARKREISKAVNEVRHLIKEHGLTPGDCGFAMEVPVSRARQLNVEAAYAGNEVVKKTRKPVPIKYRHPEDSALTWTGRGKVPKWLTEEEAKGKLRQDFLI